MPNLSPQIKSVFAAALNFDSHVERNAYLDGACSDDSQLRQEVESLLAAHVDANGFLSRAVPNVDPAAFSPAPAAVPGTQIGPYKIREQIGEGGMGEVYVAEQTEPVRRKVALKIIRPGMATKDVIARFEAERQALAMMDHPNIAKVFDGGIVGQAFQPAAPTDQLAFDGDRQAGKPALQAGPPFFVMELVQGVPITEYCDQCNLSTQERLKLFITICHAIHHAHQKGIIHRDLKPSNVLVAMQDGRPAPKVIDFGVAKAIDQRLTEHSVTTGFAKMVGTPLYMSPEQAELSPLGVDIRSDVYSLGVLMYELLTGTTPFEKERLKAAGYDELRRIIREEEPVRPSARISTIAGEAASTVAERRRTDTRRLLQAVRGDLDWIVMKCLEKDRNRRYETATDLGRDIGRYLRDEPVEARPPSVGYRMGKFARRNAGAVVAAALIFLCLAGGVVGTTLGLFEARRERDAAKIARQQQEDQRRIAQANAQRAEQAAEAQRKAKEFAVARERELRAILDFVENRIFAAARPEGQEGGLAYDATIRQAVEAALPFMESNFEDQPLIKARLQSTIGQSFLHLGDGERAAEHFQAAYAIYSTQLGADDATTLQSMNQLAASYDKLGRHAEALLLRQTVYARQEATIGVDHPETAATMGNIAMSYNRLNRYDEAIELNERALKLLRAAPHVNHRAIMACMHNLANSYRGLSRDSDAVKLHEEALRLSESTQGIDHPDALGVKHELAHSYQAVDRNGDAHELLQETYNLQKVKLGPEHPDTLKTGHCLAKSHSRFGRHDEAMKIETEVLAGRKDKLGPNHPEALESMYRLAITHFDLRDFDKAIELHKRVFAARQATLGADDQATLASMHELALCHSLLGRYDEAIQVFQELLAKYKERASTGPRGGDHSRTFAITYNLATACLDARRMDDAAQYADELVELMKAMSGPNDPSTLPNMNLLATRFRGVGRFDVAAELNEMVLARATEKFGYDHPNTWQLKRELAVSYCGVGKHDEAIKLYEGMLSLQREKLGLHDRDTLRTLGMLSTVYQEAGRLGDAIVRFEETLTLQKAALVSNDSDTLRTLEFLARACREAGRVDAAITYSEDLIDRLTEKHGFEHPMRLSSMNEYALWLATSPVARHRDPARAAELAHEIVHAEPNNGINWFTLGAAQLFMEDFSEAEKSLARARELHPDGDRSDWFLLAIAKAKQGDPEAAHAWFVKADEWMEQNQPGNEQLVRFRAEAAEVLSIEIPEREATSTDASVSTAAETIDDTKSEQ